MSQNHSEELYAELRKVAVEVAWRAADLVIGRRVELGGAIRGVPLHREGVMKTKSTVTDPVTVVDMESEKEIRRFLAEVRPQDEVLGEEEGGETAVDAEVLWVVDPIDGTVNFLYGVPAFAVSIAATIDSEIVAGAVADVPGGLVFSAHKGGGSTVANREGTTEKLQASAPASLGETLLSTGFGYSAKRRAAQGTMIAKLLPQVRDIRRIGSAAIDLCLVASGSMDAHVESGLRPWDWGAGSIIASEAGAEVIVPALNEPDLDHAITIVGAQSIMKDLVEAVHHAVDE